MLKWYPKRQVVLWLLLSLFGPKSPLCPEVSPATKHDLNVEEKCTRIWSNFALKPCQYVCFYCHCFVFVVCVLLTTRSARPGGMREALRIIKTLRTYHWNFINFMQCSTILPKLGQTNPTIFMEDSFSFHSTYVIIQKNPGGGAPTDRCKSKSNLKRVMFTEDNMHFDAILILTRSRTTERCIENRNLRKNASAKPGSTQTQFPETKSLHPVHLSIQLRRIIRFQAVNGLLGQAHSVLEFMCFCSVFNVFQSVLFGIQFCPAIVFKHILGHKNNHRLDFSKAFEINALCPALWNLRPCRQPHKNR